MGFLKKLFGRSSSSKPGAEGQGQVDQHALQGRGGSSSHLAAAPVGASEHSQQAASHQAVPSGGRQGAAAPNQGHFTRIVGESMAASGGSQPGGVGQQAHPPQSAALGKAGGAAEPVKMPDVMPPGLMGYQLDVPVALSSENGGYEYDDIAEEPARAKKVVGGEEADVMHVDANNVTAAESARSAATAKGAFTARVEEVHSTVVCDMGELDAKSPFLQEVALSSSLAPFPPRTADAPPRRRSGGRSRRRCTSGRRPWGGPAHQEEARIGKRAEQRRARCTGYTPLPRPFHTPFTPPLGPCIRGYTPFSRLFHSLFTPPSCSHTTPPSRPPHAASPLHSSWFNSPLPPSPQNSFYPPRLPLLALKPPLAASVDRRDESWPEMLVSPPPAATSKSMRNLSAGQPSTAPSGRVKAMPSKSMIDVSGEPRPAHSPDSGHWPRGGGSGDSLGGKPVVIPGLQDEIPGLQDDFAEGNDAGYGVVTPPGWRPPPSTDVRQRPPPNTHVLSTRYPVHDPPPTHRHNLLRSRPHFLRSPRRPLLPTIRLIGRTPFLSASPHSRSPPRMSIMTATHFPGPPPRRALFSVSISGNRHPQSNSYLH